MATALPLDCTTDRSARWFAATVMTVAVASCVFAGWLPLGFSIVTVFLFAGPHNWLEARYMMTKMPGRWGKLMPYFLIGLIGVPVLTAISIAMPFGMRTWQASGDVWLAGVASWNTLFVLWIAVLVQLRSQQNPRRNWIWVWPIAFLIIAVNWLWPLAWSLALVYIHPLVALVFLDRELGRRQTTWRSTYRWCLLSIPVLLGVMWWRLASAPDLPGVDVLGMQITNHAGGTIFQGISTHLLVATHTFLEMLHYGVWVIAIPLVTGAPSLRLKNVPLAKRSNIWRLAFGFVLVTGLMIAVVLWVGFLANYPLTRNVYFTVALLHVLAEVPFLLRLL